MFVDYLIGFFVFLFGLCIGSFLNCVIYRLEENKKITGRSLCPNCEHILNWKDLFPVFSWLFLKRKCRYCKAKISLQYPLAEIATGVIFLAIYNLKFEILNQFEIYQYLNIIFSFYIASALIIIFVYDLKHYIIPDKILFPAIAVTLIWRISEFFILNSNFKFQISNYLLAVLICAGFFLLIFLISKGRAMGFGDVKLAVLMGLLLGFPNILAAMFLAFFFGAIIGLILMVFGKKNLKSEIPFGPFLITGTFLAMLWGEQLVDWYMHIFLI